MDTLQVGIVRREDRDRTEGQQFPRTPRQTCLIRESWLRGGAESWVAADEYTLLSQSYRLIVLLFGSSHKTWLQLRVKRCPIVFHPFVVRLRLVRADDISRVPRF
jgi:hypothetical protein